MPARWRGHLDATRGQGRGAAYRHYWELSVLYGARARLRSGDLWVPGSRRYTDPTTLLIPAETWAGQRDDFCAVTGADADPTRQLQRLEAELHAAVTDLERVLADPTSEGLARVDEDGDLIVSPLPAEQIPAEGEALAQAVATRLPQIHLPALLIEVDRGTRFSEAFTHAGGAQPRNPDLTRNLYASLLAYACNLGYAGMADASGISEDTLAWTSQWYLRQDTLREANARLVNAHHRHPLAALWGGGTLSSSDGQRFPQRGHSLTARALSRYFLDEGTTTYTHVSDQHSTYGTTVIPTTWREAVAVLDDIFGNPTDLPIAVHTTDTAGQTLATFAIFQPRRPAVLPAHPRHRTATALPRRPRPIVANPLPARRSAAHPAHPNPADRRSLERSAPARRVDEIRVHHGQPADRQAARQQPTELARPRPAGIRPARPHPLPLSIRC